MKNPDNLHYLRDKVKDPRLGSFRHAAGIGKPKAGKLTFIAMNLLTNHAEANGLKKIQKGNGKLTLYVTRNGSGEYGGNSRPCIHCLQAMAETGRIRHVVYSDGDSYIVSTVNKLLREKDQHISSGNLFRMGLVDDEEGDDADEPNLDQ